MNFSGLTATDAAISVWGLNSAQSLSEFIFTKSFLGQFIFAIGLVTSITESAIKANLKYFCIFIFLFFTCYFLLILPKTIESNFASAQEFYGTSTFTAQALKDSVTNNQSVPVLLSYFAQMADTISMNSISLIDSAFDVNLRFLSNPFGIQKISLQAYQILHTPLADVKLRKDVSDFINAYYVPTLLLYANTDHNFKNLNSLWPGDPKITALYTNDAASGWNDIQGRLIISIADPQQPWIKIKNILIALGVHTDNFNDQVITSIIQEQMFKDYGKKWWHWAGYVQSIFPYIYGWANFIIYVTFPMMVIALIIVRRLSILLVYLGMFMWVKSWVLLSAIVYLMSLFIAHVQALSSPGVLWFWQYPYFTLVTSFLLCLVPFVSFVGMVQLFRLLKVRSN